MKYFAIFLLLVALLFAGFANAEPRVWTLSNLDPDGGGTPIPGPFGNILNGTFSLHLVFDIDGDGPDPVIDNGPSIGMPGGDDAIMMSSMQVAPSQYIQPAGVFTFFLTFDPELLNLPEDANFYIRVFEDTDLELGTRYVNSISFPMPDIPGSAQTVVEMPERMLGYIGNGSPSVFVIPEAPSASAGDALSLTVQITDDEEASVSVAVEDLPGGEQSILINDDDPDNVIVRWAIPLNAEGDRELTLLISDGDLITPHVVPVTVLAADMRPSAFQPIAPVDGGTSWQGFNTTWQTSSHPEDLEVTYTFLWATDPEFSDADSIASLTETEVQLYFEEELILPVRGGELGRLNRRTPGPVLSSVEQAETRENLSSNRSSVSLIAGASSLPSDLEKVELGTRNRQTLIDEQDLEDESLVLETIVFTGLQPGDTYYWTVRAVAQDGTDRYTPIQSAVAEIPDTPEATVLIEPTDAAVLVTTEPVFRWNIAFDSDINDTLTYDLIWSVDGGATYDTVFAIPDTVFDMSGEALDFVGVDLLRAWLNDEAERQHIVLQSVTMPANPQVLVPVELGTLSRSMSRRTGSSKSVMPELKSASSDASNVRTAKSTPVTKRSRLKNADTIKIEPESPQIDAVPDHATITWFVEAIDATENRSDPSETWTFEVDAPNLPSGFDALSPADSIIAYDLMAMNLIWTESTDNDPGQTVTYDVLATSDPGVQELADFNLFATGLESPNFILPSDQQDDLEWRWTVRAISETDTVWMHNGPLHVFVTRNDQPAEFALTWPENGELVPITNPMLDWEETVDTDLFDAISYELTWSMDEWQSVTTISDLDSTRYLLDIGLVDNDQVWWNVRAVDTNSEGRLAVEDGSNQFTIYIDDPPTPFALVSPDSGYVITEPVFTAAWQPSLDPEEAGELLYSIEFADNPEFVESMFLSAEHDTSLVVQSGLLTVGDQWWRVIATDATGMMTTSSNTWSVYVDYNFVAEWDTGIPTEFAIARSYPNPFNPVLTVVLASPKPGANVELTMHNILGREVARFAWTPATAGYKPITIDMTGHSSGAYFVRMHADGQNIATQRVTFLK
jgi:Secretion system C-terminal sorting domain